MSKECEGDCAICAMMLEELGLNAPPINWDCRIAEEFEGKK